MENLLAEFQESMLHLGVQKKDRLLLAVSGGVDSVVLTRLCQMLGNDFDIAHANFQLRGSGSEEDERFVRELAAGNGKNIHVKKFDTRAYAEKEKCAIQEAARELRYTWFNSLMETAPVTYVFLLLAHHLDDNIETMVMHFFRGTGIAGLRGMPEKKGYLIRPLLKIPKDRLLAFARVQNLVWREDPSNAGDDYTRNYFRNQLIPATALVFPGLLQNLEKNLGRFSEVESLYLQAIRLQKNKLLRFQDAEIRIPILLLKKTIPLKTILFEILKDYHFTPAQTEEVIFLMDSSNGKYVAGPTHRIIRNRRWLIIAPYASETVSHIAVDEKDETVIYPQGKISVRQLPGATEPVEKIRAIPGTEFLDADKIQFPLLLRKWKTGDYFYPLGMKKKKKLSRFFIDQKLSKTAKEKVWVLVSGSQIIWVVGHRIDERFRLQKTTRQILQVSIQQ